MTEKIHEKTNSILEVCSTESNVSKTVFEYAFKKFSWEEKSISVDGQNLTNLCFADLIVLLSDNLTYTEIILQELQGVCAEVSLKINISKTKFISN